MDAVIYVGLAVLLAVILFVAFGKKKAESPGAEQKPALETRDQAGKKRDAQPAKSPDSTEKAEKSAAKKAEARPKPSAEGAGDARAAEASTAGASAVRAAEDAPAAVPAEVEASEPPALIPVKPREPEPPSSRDVAEPPIAVPDQPRRVEMLRVGLAKSREGTGFFGKLKALFSRKEISPEIAAEIEEVLLASDVGVPTTTALLQSIRDQLGKGELKSSEAVWAAVRKRAAEVLTVDGKQGPLVLSARPTVVLLVGVNGAGKTTTIGKLATQLRAQGKKCVLAAGDTFRAAAVQQLVVWGERVGCEVVRGKDGSDPGSVIFDAIKRAEQVGADVVLADTAGRLHTKSNLMSEMQKIARTVGKAMPGAPHETLLVIDATNGQNALAQATEFKQKLELTGIVLTKLDGTAKGGVVLGIANTLGVPVRFIGLGERPDDFHEFEPHDFVDALLGADQANA